MWSQFETTSDWICALMLALMVTLQACYMWPTLRQDILRVLKALEEPAKQRNAATLSFFNNSGSVLSVCTPDQLRHLAPGDRWAASYDTVLDAIITVCSPSMHGQQLIVWRLRFIRDEAIRYNHELLTIEEAVVRNAIAAAVRVDEDRLSTGESRSYRHRHRQ